MNSSLPAFGELRRRQLRLGLCWGIACAIVSVPLFALSLHWGSLLGMPPLIVGSVPFGFGAFGLLSSLLTNALRNGYVITQTQILERRSQPFGFTAYVSLLGLMAIGFLATTAASIWLGSSSYRWSGP